MTRVVIDGVELPDGYADDAEGALARIQAAVDRGRVKHAKADVAKAIRMRAALDQVLDDPPGLAAMLEAFRFPTVAAMRAWINRNLPPAESEPAEVLDDTPADDPPATAAALWSHPDRVPSHASNCAGTRCPSCACCQHCPPDCGCSGCPDPECLCSL